MPAGSFPTDDFTVSYWVKVDEDPASTPHGRHYHMDLRGDGNQNNSNFAIFIDSDTTGDDAAIWKIWEQGTQLIKADEKYPIDTWVNAVLTRKNGKYRLFIDSVEVGSATGSGDSLTNSSSSHRWFNFSGDNDYTTEGNFTEIRYYNHALTVQEIQYLFQVGKRGRQVTSRKSS